MSPPQRRGRHAARALAEQTRTAFETAKDAPYAIEVVRPGAAIERRVLAAAFAAILRPG